MKSSRSARCLHRVRRGHAIYARGASLLAAASITLLCERAHAADGYEKPVPDFLRSYTMSARAQDPAPPPPLPPPTPGDAPDPSRQYLAPAQDPPPQDPSSPSPYTSSPAPPAYSYGAEGSGVRVRGRRSGLTWEANADLRFSYIDRIPEMKLSEDVAGVRSFQTGQTVHGTVPLTTAGVGFDFGLVLDDRWRIGGLGGSYESSIGTSARRAASVNGSIAELRPWTASRFGFDIGGFGQRFKYRRWMFGWFASAHVMLTTMNLSIAEGAGSLDASATSVAFALHAQVEVCRRLDVEARACLAIAPDVFDGGYFMRGGTIAARWEWGR